MSSSELTYGAEKVGYKNPPNDALFRPVADGDVIGEWHQTVDFEQGPTVLYFHGGGYYYGSAKSHSRATFGLAKAADARVFSQNYRLAPAYPFPAAIDDAMAGYQWLLRQGVKPEHLIVSGDSAGGGLVLALLLSCRSEGVPMPAGAILYSPWTDLAVTGASMDSNEKSDSMFRKIHIVEGAKYYLGGADPKNPLASPLYADLSGLPPILTFVSDDEALLDDSTRLQERLLTAGVDAKLVIESGLPHDWHIFYPKFPEARKTIEQSATFIRAKTAEG